jgi:signal transduction histidine kinase
VGTIKELLVCRTGGEVIARPALPTEPDEFISWKSTDRDGDVWVGTTKGVVRVFRDTTLLYQRRFDSRISGVLVDSKGFAWLHTTEGISKLKKADFSNGPLVSYGTEHGLPEPTTWPVLEDRESNLWFLTFNNGLVKLSEGGLVRFSNESFRGGAALDSAGHVWVMGPHGLWELWKQGAEQWQSVYHALADMDSIQQGSVLAFDIHWRMCLVLPAGSLRLYQLVHKPGGPSQMHRLGTVGSREGIPPGIVLRVLVDRHNRMWCSMEGLGVLIIDLNSPFHRVATLRFPADLPIASVRAMFQDKNGDMWLGDYNGGLVLLRGSDWTRRPDRHFTTQDGLPDNGIRSFAEDETGRLWVGTRFGGVAIFDGRTFQTLSIKEGLISNSIWGIARDSSSRMWLATGSGLMSVSSSNLHEFGWTGDMIGSGIDLCGVSRDGLVWFGRGGAYLSAYDTQKRTRNIVPPPVFITNVAVNDSTLSPEGQLETSFDRNNWFIQYIGISFRDEKNINYQYRLNNAEWSKHTKQRSVTFAALSPGDYSFEVRAINSDGVPSAQPAHLSFTILPPLWSRVWFQISAYVLVIAIFGSAVRLRLARIQKEKIQREEFSRRLMESQEFERKRIAAELHDGLGQNLLIIKNKAMFGLDAVTEPSKAAKQLEEISELASRSADEVRGIAYNLRPYLLDKLGLTKGLRSMFRRLEDSTEVRFTAEIDEIDNLFGKDQEINLYRILQEAANNVIKHARARNASATVKKHSNYVLFRMQDDGRGFTRSARQGDGFGFVGIAERVRILGGSWNVESELGRGTTITVIIPLKKGRA